MDTNLTIPQGLDPGAVTLARAIRKQEGGDYNNTSGDNGSSAGAYQWNNQPNGKSIPLTKGEIPSNFKSDAIAAGLDPNDFSPHNQDMVAYDKIKKLKDAGNNVVDIAAIWNGGDKNRQDPNYITPSGLPSQKKGVYDVPAYAKSVNDYYQQLKSKTNSSPYPLVPQGPTPTQGGDSGAPGNVISDVQKGDYLGAGESAIRGLGAALTGGGTEQMSNEIGSSLAIGENKISGLLGGKDYSQYVPKPDAGSAIAGGIKTAIGVGSLALGALASAGFAGAADAADALDTPVTQSIYEKFGLGGASDVANMSTAEKYDALQQAVQSGSLSPSAEFEAKQAIASIENVASNVAKSPGLMSKVLKYGKKAAIGYAIDKMAGDPLGGIVKKIIGFL